VEKGAASRTLYLPRGDWYDFWTNERVAGGREITRAVDLGTMPLYVRAGAVLPLDPVRQYVGESVDQPTALTVYPGADGSAALYEDDGVSFDYRQGANDRMLMNWENASRRLALSVAPGSRPLGEPRQLFVRASDGGLPHLVWFNGRPVEVQL